MFKCTLSVICISTTGGRTRRRRRSAAHQNVLNCSWRFFFSTCPTVMIKLWILSSTEAESPNPQRPPYRVTWPLCTNQELGACLRARALETGHFIELHSFFSSRSASIRDICTSFDPSGCTETHISPASGVPLGCCCPSGIHPRTRPPVRGRKLARNCVWNRRTRGSFWKVKMAYPGYGAAPGGFPAGVRNH